MQKGRRRRGERRGERGAAGLRFSPSSCSNFENQTLSFVVSLLGFKYFVALYRATAPSEFWLLHQEMDMMADKSSYSPLDAKVTQNESMVSNDSLRGGA